ncbi:MAG: preprotein translocase subunit SecY [Aigarchaeota archaeon]|nr:preprotein translocase subunit SecY [Aigarchaeota archaeon]MCX8193074.1 preprotein translocase subunit SecY [Nitrososphaeria archaeon]MDW7986923.1 preprotein translocase subunit SecY [Nitrososphaerota archaeon]
MASAKEIVKNIGRYFPEVKKPERKLGLGERFIWTGLVLVIYVLMSHTFLYGVPQAAKLSQQNPIILNIIFAQRIGTLTTLGIGPIVTSGLILQLLVGAQIIKLDLSKSEDRAVFTAASKIFAIVVTIFEAAVFTFSGWLGHMDTHSQILVFIQLVTATILIILMDELVQKGWGLGSGVSLFIAAGVAETIIVSLFSPIILPDGYYQGIILALIQAAVSGMPTSPLLVRGQFPDILGLISTSMLLLIIIYLEAIRVEVPIQYAKYSGFAAKYPIKFLYVSNIPVIFASTVFTNIYYLSSIVWSRFNVDNSNVFLNVIGMFNSTSYHTDRVLTPIGGLAYYVTAPYNISGVLHDPVKAGVYALIMITFCLLFAKFWVDIGGLSPEKVAEQLVKAGMQVPGFRRSPGTIAKIIKKYISTVTILGALVVATVATVGDYFNVFGGGIGILLMSGILYQYYQILVRERLAEMHPALGRLLGEE